MSYNFIKYNKESNYRVFFDPILNFEYYESSFDGVIYFINDHKHSIERKFDKVTVVSIKFTRDTYFNQLPIPFKYNQKLLVFDNNSYSIELKLENNNKVNNISISLSKLSKLSTIVEALNYFINLKFDIEKININRLVNFAFPTYTSILNHLIDLKYNRDYSTTRRPGKDEWEHYKVFISNIPNIFIAQIILKIIGSGDILQYENKCKIVLRGEYYYNYNNFELDILTNFDKIFKIENYIFFLLTQD